MKPATSALSFLAGTLAACATLEAATFKFGDQTLTVPDGFVVERVAGPGLVDRPIVADFDEEGRLYVAESSGSNDPVKKQLEERPHWIVRLSDRDGDGVFDQRTVFADKMMFPEGAMWLDGSLYVSAPPSIWKLTDTDGDGVADRREEWYDAKTLTGCANDLHGPYLGLDGWIYWCKGAFAKQTHELAGGGTFETRAAHIFRRRPEGGGVEPVMTGGMDNPVDVVFTPEGERIFTTTFFQHPGGGQRDGLIHAIYGGRYGKMHDVLEDHPKTGDVLPVLTHLGPAAPAGLARYKSGQFGAEYRDNLFAACFNLHKISRHELEPNGATFRTKDSDFVVSDSTDFHPTDVIEDADGSLLVIDTGGWYKLCCPTSQLWKPDVLGAIYRVRRAGEAAVKDARGLQIDWKGAAGELTKFLDDSRPAVRNRAIRELGKRGGNAVSALKEVLERSKRVEVRRNAIWALTQMDAAGAREAVRMGMKDESASVRHAAAHSASVRRDEGAVSDLLVCLEQSNEAVKRAAAEALGRLGDARTVSALLREAGKIGSIAAKEEPARVLEHSLIYALIEIANPEQTRKGLDSPNIYERRASLIALDQMKQGGLEAGRVAELLGSSEPLLKETAEWIAGQHDDWGNVLAGHYEKQLARDDLSERQEGEIEQQLARLASSEGVQNLLSKVAGSAESSLPVKRVALAAMARARLKSPPEEWLGAIEAGLKERSAVLVSEAVRAAVALPEKEVPDSLRKAMAAVAQDGRFPGPLRLEALAGSVKGELDRASFEFVLAQLEREESLSVRNTALNILGKAKLSDEQLLMLTRELKKARPLDVGRLLAPFEKSSSEKTGLALVSSLKESTALAGLNAGQLNQLLAKYPERVRAEGAPLVKLLDQDLEKQMTQLNELLPQLKEGDIRRGQAIFNSTRAACSSCHAIGYLGGDLGPDLTRIGQIRTERDLLEAVIYPSASFVRSYEPVLVRTHGEEEYSGILRKDAPDELVIATGPGAEVRIAREDVAEVRPGKVSVMPQGLDQQLTRQEMADLLAFLKATRW